MRKANETTEFFKAVVACTKRIPKGKVATYGQIARLAGNERGARGVGWILHSSAKKYKLPWQRVISSQGKISFPKSTSQFATQRRLLRREGVDVDDRGRIDLLEYQWHQAATKRRT
ncbi:MAG: DNA methyltransferase [Bdellovibrionaceae bacterium]|nr:DNA methyltransferase [Pseudobdellovibrionaceae bacterium]